MNSFFHGAHDFHVEEQNLVVGDVNYIYSSSLEGPLKELASRIAPGAVHDSAERCDAPKCHPETRVAVQEDLYCWIVKGDQGSGRPRKIKWVTGPAGSGKTAIMGSLADRCAGDGILGATFFFSSWSAYIGRRRKTAFVLTIAYQLAEHRKDLKNSISRAISENPSVFQKNLHVQMETLVLAPLREAALRSDRPSLQGAIIIDGVDECEAEQYQDATRFGLRGKPIRTNEQDQQEILEVLLKASLDPSFPFRILIASRPERVFREFFDQERDPTSFARKLDLHEDYNADADMVLFLEAQFSRIRRRYNLRPSWPPPGTIQALVTNASGQFIYVATVIRFLDVGEHEPSKAALDAILKIGAKTTWNPLEQLDLLYSHILRTSPDPVLSVLWIRCIERLNPSNYLVAEASSIQLLLQADPESSEAEYLLGNLHSLVRIPAPADQATTAYGFYHKTLFDFLKDPDRCGKLYIEEHQISVFIWDAFVRACEGGCDPQCSYPDRFLRFLALLPFYKPESFGDGHPQLLPTAASADWLVSSTIAYRTHGSVWKIFQKIHQSCPWYRCKPACRIWSRTILRQLGSASWIAPGVFWPMRRIEFDRLVKKAANRLWDP